MPQRKLGVLIHGAGWVSTQHIDAYKKNPQVQILAICSLTVDEGKARATSSGLEGITFYDDLNKALAHPGIDIVSICTPQQFHPANAITVAKAGKHMVIEKPAAMELSDLRAMQAAVTQAKVKTLVGFVLRWNPLFRTLKRMAADGAFGSIYSVETDYHSYCGDWWGGYREGRTIKAGGNAYLSAGCHAIDALRWFASGDEFGTADPVEVFGWAGGKRGQSTRQYHPIKNSWHEGEPLEFPGLEMAMIRFSNGVLGKVSVNFECIQPYGFPIRIFGDQGTVKDNKVWSHKYPGQKDWVTLPVICPDSSDVSHHPFQGEIDHFVECVLTDRESHCNLADAVKTHEIIFALQQCYKSGAPVKLPLR